MALLLLLFILISFFLMSKKPQEYPKYDSESPSPTGVKALYTYLQREKGSVDRWSYNPKQLAKQGNHQLLIMVEPFLISDQTKMNEYENYMKKGNTILLLKSNPDGLFNLKTKAVAKAPSDSEVIYDHNGAKHRGEMHSPVRLQKKKSDKTILHDKAGTIAMERSFGEGKLIVANAPDWLTNDDLLDKDHLPLVLSLLQTAGGDKDTVLFDENSHGSTHTLALFTVYPKWLLVAAAQIILLAIIWLWVRGKRFGPVLIPREETVRFSDERIKALAAWYQRGRNYQDSLTLQADYVRYILQERWGIPYRKGWMEISEPLSRSSTSLSDKEIRGFLEGIINVLRKHSLSKQEYLLWSKRIDRLRKEVEEG